MGGERRERGQGRSKDRGTVSWGLADEAEKGAAREAGGKAGECDVPGAKWRWHLKEVGVRNCIKSFRTIREGKSETTPAGGISVFWWSRGCKNAGEGRFKRGFGNSNTHGYVRQSAGKRSEK